MKHYNITVRGRVQGVFFRDSARKEARLRGLKGFVKNRNDGSVYIEAEGDSEQLNAFVRWCRQGPEYARVEDVEIEHGEVRNYRGFEVVY